MSPVEQVIAELTARRLAAQDTVDECDQALTALRKLLEPTLPGLEPPRAKRHYTRRLTVKVKNGRVLVRKQTSGRQRGGRKPDPVVTARRARIVEMVTKLKRMRGREIRDAFPDVPNAAMRNTLNKLRVAGELARDGVFWFKP